MGSDGRRGYGGPVSPPAAGALVPATRCFQRRHPLLHATGGAEPSAPPGEGRARGPLCSSRVAPPLPHPPPQHAVRKSASPLLRGGGILRAGHAPPLPALSQSPRPPSAPARRRFQAERRVACTFKAVPGLLIGCGAEEGGARRGEGCLKRSANRGSLAYVRLRGAGPVAAVAAAAGLHLWPPRGGAGAPSGSERGNAAAAEATEVALGAAGVLPSVPAPSAVRLPPAAAPPPRAVSAPGPRPPPAGWHKRGRVPAPLQRETAATGWTAGRWLSSPASPGRYGWGSLPS